MTKRVEYRFYWAPVLDVLLKTVPPNVQIVNLSGSNDPKSDKISVLLEGVVAGDVPRIAADQFRTLLNERLAKQYPGATSNFRSLDDTTRPSTSRAARCRRRTSPSSELSPSPTPRSRHPRARARPRQTTLKTPMKKLTKDQIQKISSARC